VQRHPAHLDAIAEAGSDIGIGSGNMADPNMQLAYGQPDVYGLSR
jgi:hypothetical protein